MPVSDFFFWSDFYIFSIQQNAKSRWRCGSFWMSLFFFCEFKNELWEDIRISGKWHITMLFFKELWSAENSAIFSFKIVSTSSQILVQILVWFLKYISANSLILGQILFLPMMYFSKIPAKINFSTNKKISSENSCISSTYAWKLLIHHTIIKNLLKNLMIMITSPKAIFDNWGARMDVCITQKQCFIYIFVDFLFDFYVKLNFTSFSPVYGDKNIREMQ